MKKNYFLDPNKHSKWGAKQVGFFKKNIICSRISLWYSFKKLQQLYHVNISASKNYLLITISKM